MAKTDYTYPPDRKRPRGENRRALPAKKNAYRSADASASRKGESGPFSSKMLLLALAGGAAFAWFKASAGTTASVQPVLPTGSGSNGSTTTPPATGGSTVLPVRAAVVGPITPNRYVFIDSVGGENLYEKLRQTGSYPDGYGIGSTLVERGMNGELIGRLTGRSFQPKTNFPAMLQIYAELPGGFTCNYWVDAEEVVTMTEAAAQQAINTGKGTLLRPEVAESIQDYFAKRYRA